MQEGNLSMPRNIPRYVKYFLPFVWILCVTPALQSQQEPLVLKSTTRLVQVNAIIHRGGQPVTDLKAADFQVFDDGKPQKISFFQMETNAILPASTSPLPPNTFTNHLEQQSGTPSAVTVILLDALNTRLTDQAYAKQQVIKFLQTIEPDDHIGIYTLGGSLRVLHDYTNDSRDLLRQLAAYNPQLPIERVLSTGSDTGNNELLEMDNWLGGRGLAGGERDFYTVNRVIGTLRALEFIADHLSAIPGRKNLIWVSGGFPSLIGFDNPRVQNDPSRTQSTFTDEISRTVRALNDANVAVYPVDARGLMVDPRYSAEKSGAEVIRQTRPGAWPRPPVGSKNQDTMIELADRTGGRAYYNTNDFKHAIRDAVSDAQVTYTIGFYPEKENFDSKFHKISLKVAGSGLNVRYRKGYFDLPQSPQDDAARKAELRDAVWSPLDATAIPLVAQMRPGQGANSWDVWVKIERSGVSLEQSGDRWAGKLDILFVQKDTQGRQFNGLDNTIQLNVKQENYDKISKDGFLFHQPIERNARASELRVAVRDAASGNIGTVTVPFNQLTK
jgi:VWFA-related protein